MSKAKKSKKHRKAQLERCTRLQLVALATQKGVVPYAEALEMEQEALVARLVEVADVLVPATA
jgi:hypothetical protein